MRYKIIVAFFLLLLGATNILDWIIFSVRNGKLPFNEMKIKYINRFPPGIAEFYSHNIRLVGLLFCLMLLISGILFLTEKRIIFISMGIVGLILNFWQFFTIM